MEFSGLLLAAFGLFCAGIIKGTTGLGYASCALPFLVPVVGLKSAIALVVIPALASNLQIVATTAHFRETLSRFGILYAAMIPGIGVGLLALTTFDPEHTTKLLGLVIILYAGMSLAQPNFALGTKASGELMLPVGLANGFLTGFTGSQVMPLLPYVMSLHLDTERTVQAVNLAVTIASLVLTVGLFATGIITFGNAHFAAAALIPALIGVAIGTKLRSHIPKSFFRKIVLAMLLLFGVSFLA